MIRVVAVFLTVPVNTVELYSQFQRRDNYIKLERCYYVAVGLDGVWVNTFNVIENSLFACGWSPPGALRTTETSQVTIRALFEIAMFLTCDD